MSKFALRKCSHSFRSISVHIRAFTFRSLPQPLVHDLFLKIRPNVHVQFKIISHKIEARKANLNEYKRTLSRRHLYEFGVYNGEQAVMALVPESLQIQVQSKISFFTTDSDTHIDSQVKGCAVFTCKNEIFYTSKVVRFYAPCL